MTTFKKNYIGKGTQVGKLDIVRVTLKVSEIEAYAHEYQGEMYISFEVAKMQKPDQYKKTHTVYVSEKVVEEA